MSDFIDREEWEAAQRDTVIRLRTENENLREDLDRTLKSWRSCTETAERNVKEYEQLEAAHEALKSRLAEMDRAFINQQVRLKMLAEQWAHGKAVELLRAHEWVLDGRECTIYCLHCGRERYKGHTEDCEGFGLRGCVPPDVAAVMP